MQNSQIQFEIEVTNVDGSVRKLHYFGNEAAKTANKAAAAFSKQANVQNVTVRSTGELADATQRVSAATDRAYRAQSNWFAHIAKTTVLSALVNKSFLAIQDSASRAIEQLDLIENFPASMQALGISADDASESLARLREYVNSVGGDLTTAANAVTRFVSVNKDVRASVAMYAGVNNALIAGGASAEAQKSAIEQLIQGYTRGRIEGEEWRSMQTAMNLAMVETAKALDMPSTVALRDALTEGEISMNSFMATMAEVSTGTGPVAEAAMANMQGVGFAGAVLKNTMVNSLTAIYQAVGRQNIVAVFSVITQVIATLASWVVTLINLFISLINVIRGLFGMKPLAGISGDAESTRKSLEGSVDSADNLGKGLKGAGKEAKKLAGSLASFDKMNVLPDRPDSGGGGAGGGGAGGGSPSVFDPLDASALDKIFDSIGGKIGEVSKLAKVLAGILAGLASNALISRLARLFGFNINPLRAAGAAIGQHLIRPLGTAIKTATQVSATFSKSLGKGLFGKGSGGSGVIGSAAKYGTRIGLAIRAGILGGVGAIGTALTALIAPVATALSVPFWVAAGVVALAVAAIVAIIWTIWTNWDTISTWLIAAWAMVKDFAVMAWNLIKGAAESAWNWIVGAWNKLYGIFEGPIKWLLQFVEATLTLIIALVALFLEGIFKLVKGTVTLVYNVLKAIAGWINENVVKPVLRFLKGLWDGAVSLVTDAWKWIFDKVLKPIGSWVSINVVQPVFNSLKSLWERAVGLVTGFWNGVKAILSPIWGWVRANVVDKIFNLFDGLWKRVKKTFESLKEGLKGVFGGFANIIKTPINGVIDLINKALSNMNKIKVPDWVPGAGGKGVNFPMIPRLARGGIVDQATLALVGEAGDEAVIPLENNTEGLDRLASLINDRMGNGQPVQVVVQIGEERIATKMIDLINDRSYMSGRNVINV